MMRVGQVMGKSAGIMKTMNALVNGPAMTATMRAMSAEMTKARQSRAAAPVGNWCCCC